ncbi:3-isopropylmalate dehydratase [Thermoplasmatales archaeon SG8-52-2]|nr:MAG: 3-isopropylmalate dehydratase [Thermoplasmatales archaeon SG8-52-2]
MNIWKYDDNIDTDMLFPGKYVYTCSIAEEIKPHLLEDLDPSFSKNVKKGDIIIAGKNFGCGSSREQPVIGLKAVGIKVVIAKSFARIFYRAAINQGLVLIECPDAVEYYSKGKNVEIDMDNGKITVGDKSFSFPRLPEQIIAIRNAGGLLEYTRDKLKNR